MNRAAQDNRTPDFLSESRSENFTGKPAKVLLIAGNLEWTVFVGKHGKIGTCGISTVLARHNYVDYSGNYQQLRPCLMANEGI